MLTFPNLLIIASSPLTVKTSDKYKEKSDISDELTALKMVAVSSSETSVNIYQTTRHNIPQDSHLRIRRRETLKSHVELIYRPQFLTDTGNYITYNLVWYSNGERSAACSSSAMEGSARHCMHIHV
jgi:hypothetical protein